jgi:putative membrane protein
MAGVSAWVAFVVVLLAATIAAAQGTPPTPSPWQDRNLAEMIAWCNQMMGGWMMGRGMMGGPDAWLGWWFPGVWLFWLILLALAVTVVVLFVRQRPADGSSAALAALQLRFAKGEISADEYEQARRLLRG